MSFWKRVGINGPTSNQILSSQDGNGRIQRSWNATYGTNKRFITSGEPAFFEDANIIHDPYYTIKYAEAGVRGQVINWNNHLSIQQDGKVIVHNNLTAQNYLGELSGSVINTEYKDATVTIYGWSGTSSWSGSGSFITINGTSGYVVTNAHVVCAGDERTPKADNLWIQVSNINGTGLDKMIKVTTDFFVDGLADVAIVRVPGITSAQKHLTFADYSTVHIGDLAYIFGNPRGIDGQSLSMGVVRDSGYSDPTGYILMKNITLSTPGLSGNSGSPILNKNGEVIGIYAWGIIGEETIGGGLNGEMLQQVCEKLLSLQSDYITKRFLGLEYISTAKLFGYVNVGGNDYDSDGLYILNVLTNSPLYGILGGGLVLHSMTVNGTTYEFKESESTTPAEVVHMIDSTQSVDFTYSSLGGSNTTVSVSLTVDYSGGNIVYDIPIGGAKEIEGKTIPNRYVLPK